MVASVFSFLTEWPGHGGPKDLKTLAVLTCDNLFCQDNRKIANELLPNLGFQIVLDLTTKTGATTLASEVQRLQAANPDILFLVQYPPETSIFQGDAKRAGFAPKVIATSNGAYSDQTWLDAQKKTNGGAGWIGRDPTAIDLVHDRPSWKKVNEIYRKYSRGQNMGELAMREITGLLWMADTINRAKSVEPAALAKAAMETDTPPEQLIIDYKGIRFDKNHQNELATGLTPLVALVPVGLAMYGLGVLVYRQLMRRVQRGDPFTQIFATVGLLFLLQNSAVAVFTSDYRYLSNTLLTRLSDANLHILGITVGVPLLIGALLALVLFLGLYLLIDRTEFGLALQATAEDREAAMLVGIRPQKMFAVAWGLGAALVAVAGTILANFFAVFPPVGFPFTVLAYAIVALGGFGSILGTLLAALLVGVVQSVTTVYLPPAFKDAFVFASYIVIGLCRPQGLFGRF